MRHVARTKKLDYDKPLYKYEIDLGRSLAVFPGIDGTFSTGDRHQRVVVGINCQETQTAMLFRAVQRIVKKPEVQEIIKSGVDTWLKITLIKASRSLSVRGRDAGRKKRYCRGLPHVAFLFIAALYSWVGNPKDSNPYYIQRITIEKRISFRNALVFEFGVMPEGSTPDERLPSALTTYLQDPIT